MVMHGLTTKVISKVMKMSEGSLYNHYREELEEGRAILGGKLSSLLAHKALSGDKASLFFILKTQFGYRETNRYEHTGADGKPIQMQATATDIYDKLSDAALVEIFEAEGVAALEAHEEKA